MNHNRKRREAEDRERRRREAAMKDAVPVDPAALSPCNSYFPPDFVERGYYLDLPFTCASCGSDEVWTAAQQQWWYETAKGSLYSGARLCRRCRRDARLNKGKAHPLQDFNRWLALLRDELEPTLTAADWTPVVGVGETRPGLLSYDRNDVLVRFRWDHGCHHTTLLLERRDGRDAPFETLAQVECDSRNMTHQELQRRFDRLLTDSRIALGLVEKP
ncbi:zinc-ribbon domain containing protein [Planctomyces sp. SH-PL62]|uniref:zinc-ribbon domain containing protein n=1 Tax=Planctomyces sp. SH-PL62 TaxID=1636152 RepID=UPI00078BDB63|nr:zinc-ribbon domain containing protein [Planctomyces sp. SH-PL62]AMV38520.1 hypothetical protein VT85_13875 [Planctomyces sp. SH-PL62]